MVWRQRPRASVIQICWIAPEPSMSASVKVSPGWMITNGETFQPCPRSRAALAAGPSVDMPPLPFSPVKFSGLIERVFARDRRERLPRLRFRPLNSVMDCSLRRGGDPPKLLLGEKEGPARERGRMRAYAVSG